ncbi:glycosyltransferase family 4 protein [Nakamurella leprariae]|uniref:Glycosyltransferase family 4 protein n=1 Tax=Nakamurella leprariae TaxID=2803911 RepID=A0A938YEB3_9ACTN|nr:glycosyltransferase family 1 protein [Nakamurella leprariae]MBM9469142.1 glycosyltransferase family 4 protein [Nakamurella leprariae]
MFVAIDATSIGSGLGGDETLMLGLLRGLVATLRGGTDPAGAAPHRLVLLADRDATLPIEVTEHPTVRVDRCRRRPGPVHFTVTSPSWLARVTRRSGRPDVVLSVTHAPVRSPAPVALVVTDLSFVRVPAAYPWLTRLRLQAMVRRQAPRAAQVVTISEFCRRDILDEYGLAQDRVSVVPLVVDEPVDGPSGSDAARAELAAHGVSGRFLLYLGNLHPRKNVARALRAFLTVAEQPGMDDVAFVVAGGRWFAGSEEQAVATAAPDGRIAMLGRVSTAQREVLLRDAAALVYPSTFEGFGLPPLEAMTRGTVVVAADATAVPEVCGDAALLVDPLDETAIGRAMVRAVTDEPLRAELVDRGRQRAAMFTVERTGTAAWVALHAAAARSGAPAAEPLAR